MSDSGEQSFVSRGLVGTASKRGPLDASRRVRVVDAGRGGWVGRVRCQCESALFPALDAWSVSLVTADLPVFTLSLHSSSSSGLQCTDLCDHAWLCVTCGVFFLWFFFAKTKHSTHGTRTAFLPLYIGLGGALHLNLTAALCRVLCRELSLSIWRCHKSRKSRCAVRPRLV